MLYTNERRIKQDNAAESILTMECIRLCFSVCRSPVSLNRLVILLVDDFSPISSPLFISMLYQMALMMTVCWYYSMMILLTSQYNSIKFNSSTFDSSARRTCTIFYAGRLLCRICNRKPAENVHV